MEDYTYHLEPGNELVLGAHMLEICPTIAGGQAARSKFIRSASAARRTRRGWCSTAAAGPAVNASLIDLGNRFRLLVNEVDAVDAGQRDAEAAGGARAVEAAAVAERIGAKPGFCAGGAHHTVLLLRGDGRAAGRLGRNGGHRMRRYRQRDERLRFPERAAHERDVLADAPIIGGRPGIGGFPSEQDNDPRLRAHE